MKDGYKVPSKNLHHIKRIIIHEQPKMIILSLNFIAMRMVTKYLPKTFTISKGLQFTNNPRR
jgi:hypothetical protein